MKNYMVTLQLICHTCGFPTTENPIKFVLIGKNNMKYSVIDFDEDSESIVFTNNIIGSYSFESFFGNFQAQESPFLVDYVSSQIENFSLTNSSKCINVVENLVNKNDIIFWTLYFDGLKSNEGEGIGCIFNNLHGEKNYDSLQIRV